MVDEADRSRKARPHHWSVSLGRIAGIEVRVHASFLILVVLFAALAPEPGVASALRNVGWLMLVFACVVVHELSHCFVARRRGAQVDEILLFPLGGVSRLRNLPESPRDELAIAIVGPLTSIGLAVLAGFGAVLLGQALVPVDLLSGGLLVRLAWLNLILGMFNLLPAFPLDGGRVLRALLERTRSLEAATRAATRVGHAFAAGLMVAGFFFDVWLLLIGIFVYFGASAEEAATIVHARLRGHHVRDAMEPITADAKRVPGITEAEAPDVEADAPLDDEVLEELQGAPAHTVIVRDHGEVVGVLKPEDVIRLVSEADAADEAQAG
jgi:Zn-dependent protease